MPDAGAAPRVLLLCYYYPPMGGGGVQRVLKFSKYLARLGVQVTVVCADDPAYVHDASLAAEIPTSADIVRLRHTTLVTRLLAWRRRWADGSVGPVAEPAVRPPGSRVRRITRWLLRLHDHLTFPDDKRGWARLARRAIGDLHAQGRRWDVVVSTSPPYSCHTLAAWAKARYGLPWIADYRDFWSDNPENDRHALRRALERRYERRLLGRADHVVTVGEHMAERYRSGFGVPAARTHVIANGYDEDDFAGHVPANRGDWVEIACVGTLYGKRDPEPFLRAFAELTETRPELHLRVTFAGNVGAGYRALLAQYGARLPGRVRQVDYLPHGEAVQAMLDADLLLLIVGADRSTLGDLTGKIFEYLRAGRPILLVGQAGGDAASLLRQLNRGLAVDAADTPAIADTLARLADGRHACDLGREAILGYSREHQARQLLAVILATMRQATAKEDK